MVDIKINGTHVLRGYLWAFLDNNTFMNPIEVYVNGEPRTVIPVVPLSDEPLLRDSKQTYIVYGYAENEPDYSVVHSGTMSLRIVAKNFGELSQVMGLLTVAFEEGDIVARNINEWSSSIPQFRGIRFGYACTTYVESGDPETTEGGQVEGVVNIRYRYLITADPGAIKTFKNGTWS